MEQQPIITESFDLRNGAVKQLDELRDTEQPPKEISIGLKSAAKRSAGTRVNVSVNYPAKQYFPLTI